MTDKLSKVLSVLATSSSPEERRAAATALLSECRAVAPQGPSTQERLAIVLEETWREIPNSRPQLVAGLVHVVRTDPSLLTIEVAAGALALEGEDGVTELLTLGTQADFAIRSKVVIGLSLLGRSARWAVPALIRFLDRERVEYVARLIVSTLGRIGGREAIAKLKELASVAERDMTGELAAEINTALGQATQSETAAVSPTDDRRDPGVDVKTPRQGEDVVMPPLGLELMERLLEYGTTNDASLADPISALYARAIAELPQETRMQMVLDLSQLAEERKISGNPLFPFLFRDPAPAIVSTAALNLAILWPHVGDDPLASIRYLAQQARHCADRGEDERAASMVGGLLVLGDRRVTDDLKGCWRWLSIDGRAALLSRLNSGFVHAPVVDWLIDWLEDCEGGEFGTVAAALTRLSPVANLRGVVEVQRALPIWSAADGQPLREIARWSFGQFGERIRPRLELIAENESEPRVMHNVLEEWDLHPSGPQGQIRKLKRDSKAWSTGTGQVLMTWSIFNPNGPTLNCVGLLDKAPGVKEVFYRWLHFLDDQTWRLGLVDTWGPNWQEDVFRIVGHAFSIAGNVGDEDFNMVTCVPSLVTHALTEQEVCHLLGLSQEIQRADWGREMYYLRKYGSRLFDRAGEEIREAMQKMAREKPLADERQRQFEQFTRIRYGRVPTFADNSAVEYETKPFEPALFAEWWATISDPRFTAFGSGQLASAWVGAIHMNRELQPPLPVVVEFDDVREFLSRFQHPLWPDQLTASSLRESMGLE
jgi:hypothetical protein